MSCATNPTSGSSPRMRGTRGENPKGQLRGRFIPAYAGNTSGCRKNIIPDTVHPRVCGEHFPFSAGSAISSGSSPRMRGTLFLSFHMQSFLRFIPAYAGNTFSRKGKGNVGSVHPRVCGEHPPGSRNPVVNPGSSPRMRGTRQRAPAITVRQRFIPAYAGNTFPGPPAPCCRAVHPRVCGEHDSEHPRSLSASGSSPRMRGTQPCGRLRLRRRRFIPAYAGNTPNAHRNCCLCAVHPRVCGEHVVVGCALFREHGSSPRMRGTRRGRLRSVSRARFIPAYAGNT